MFALRLAPTALIVASACSLMACLDGAGGTTVGSSASSAASGGGDDASGGMMAAGGEGATSDTTTTTTSGTGGMDACVDQGIGEPNETENSATQLAGTDDCDPLSRDGTLDGPADVDWYAYVQTTDEAGCNVAPGRDWSQTAGGALRVCKYVQCHTGTPLTSVGCSNGALADTSPDGRIGCCGTAPFEVDIGLFGCDGGDDLVNVWTRIDEPGAASDSCNHYNLNYHF